MIGAILMNKIAVYQQKTELSRCRKINLIYGNNGTGKTLLSNYLQDPSQPAYADCSIRRLFVLSHRKECTKKLRAADRRLETVQDLTLWILQKKDGITRTQEFKIMPPRPPASG